MPNCYKVLFLAPGIIHHFIHWNPGSPSHSALKYFIHLKTTEEHLPTYNTAGDRKATRPSGSSSSNLAGR